MTNIEYPFTACEELIFQIELRQFVAQEGVTVCCCLGCGGPEQRFGFCLHCYNGFRNGLIRKDGSISKKGTIYGGN